MDIQRAYDLHRDLLELQEADRAAGGNVLASSHIDSNPNRYEEDVDGREDRDSQERREVPLRRAEQERREIVAERTVRRQAEHEAGRVFVGEGRERCGDRRRDQAGRRCREKQRTSPQNEALSRYNIDHLAVAPSVSCTPWASTAMDPIASSLTASAREVARR